MVPNATFVRLKTDYAIADIGTVAARAWKRRHIIVYSEGVTYLLEVYTIGDVNAETVADLKHLTQT